jgi:hypothetical protein
MYPARGALPLCPPAVIGGARRPVSAEGEGRGKEKSAIARKKHSAFKHKLRAKESPCGQQGQGRSYFFFVFFLAGLAFFPAALAAFFFAGFFAAPLATFFLAGLAAFFFAGVAAFFFFAPVF